MAESIENQLGVADVYAASLFELAARENQVDQALEELCELSRLLKSEPDFCEFMESSALDELRRAAGLERMFRGRLNDLVLNTIQVMCLHGRHGLLPALARRFAQRKEDAAGQVAVLVRSATELDAAQRAEVERTAATLSGRKPVPTYRVDPALLGGLVIEFEDRRFDNSVRRQLQAAHQALRERSERGISVAAN